MKMYEGAIESAADGTHRYVFAGFSLDPRRRQLFSEGGSAIPLSPRAYDTLLYLLEHPNQIVDKRCLMKAVWPNTVVEENNLNQHILIVRRALGESPTDHRFIVTVTGRGFQFVPPVTLESQRSTPIVPLAPTSPPRTSARRAASLIIAILLLLLATGVSWYVLKPLASIDDASPAAHKLRLAVLPFENLSADPRNAFYADGLQEEIMTAIARRLSGIDVISHTTMMSYRTSSPKPLATVAHELQATYFIEGAVQREGEHMRVSLRLVEARTDRDLWSTDYDRTGPDTFDLESQVAEDVARQLSGRLTLAPRTPQSPM